MDTFVEPGKAIAFSMWLLLLLLNNTENRVSLLLLETDEDDEDRLLAMAENVQAGFLDAQNEMRATLHHFRLCIAFNFLDEELGFWVKPRSTTWFSRFLLEQYDNA